MAPQKPRDAQPLDVLYAGEEADFVLRAILWASDLDCRLPPGDPGVREPDDERDEADQDDQMERASFTVRPPKGPQGGWVRPGQLPDLSPQGYCLGAPGATFSRPC